MSVKYNTIQQPTIQPLFTLGSVYSTSASGAEQTIERNNSNITQTVKNPNWREADQLAIYKSSREVELGATENNIS